MSSVDLESFVFDGTAAPPKRAKVERAPLDTDQEAALALAVSGANIFLTGGAGTGKSFTLHRVISTLRSRGNRVAITGSTGGSAVSAGGMTIHSFLGLKAGRELLVTGRRHGATIKNSPKFAKTLVNICSADTLIIEEVSMISDRLFNFADEVMRVCCGDMGSPFGGAQVIVCGDFFQLRPVDRDNIGLKMAFFADSWALTDFTNVVLKVHHRQSKDCEYAEMLVRIRQGVLCLSDLRVLRTRIRATFPDDGIKPIHLCSRNRQADDENWKRLCELDAKTEQSYEAQLDFTIADKRAITEPEVRDYIGKSMHAPQRVVLRVGANVVLVANKDVSIGLANGSVGKVTGFSPPDSEGACFPVIKFACGVTRTIYPHEWSFDLESRKTWSGTYTQVPLLLGYAITIHRSQGMTLDRVFMRLGVSDVFSGPSGFHMSHVGLSRVRSIDDLSLGAIEIGAVRADPDVVAYYESIA